MWALVFLSVSIYIYIRTLRFSNVFVNNYLMTRIFGSPVCFLGGGIVTDHH